MSDYEVRPGSGTVWLNDRFESGGNQPYAKGKFVGLDGEEMEITLWEPKSAKIAGRAFNISIQEPWEKRRDEQTSSEKPNSASRRGGDEVPF